MPLLTNAQSKDHIGSWKMTMETNDGPLSLLLTFLDNGAHQVDFGVDGQVDINGKYDFKEGVVTLKEEQGVNACVDATGKYELKVEGDTLTMTLIEDDCVDRRPPNGRYVFSRV